MTIQELAEKIVEAFHEAPLWAEQKAIESLLRQYLAEMKP